MKSNRKDKQDNSQQGKLKTECQFHILFWSIPSQDNNLIRFANKNHEKYSMNDENNIPQTINRPKGTIEMSGRERKR